MPWGIPGILWTGGRWLGVALLVPVGLGCSSNSDGGVAPPALEFAGDAISSSNDDTNGPGFTRIISLAYDRAALNEPLTVHIGLQGPRGPYDLQYEIHDGISDGSNSDEPLSEQWPSSSGSHRVEKVEDDDETFDLVLDGPRGTGAYTLQFKARPAPENPVRLSAGPVNAAVIVDKPAVTDEELAALTLRAADGQAITTVQQLVEEFAPILRLADGEHYHPQSVETALNQARVRVGAALQDDEVGSARDLVGTLVDPSAIIEFDDVLSPDPSDVVYYASLHRSERGLAIGYWFFYAANDWKSFQPAGNDHQGDWEGLAILFDAPDETRVPPAPTRIALSQHLQYYPELIRLLLERIPDEDPQMAEELAQRVVDVLSGGEVAEWDSPTVQRSGNHPVLYVAPGSHATYFDPGPHNYICGARDEPSGDGIAILPPSVTGSDLGLSVSGVLACTVTALPHLSDITPESPFAWLRFPGRWGRNDDTSVGALGNPSSDDLFCTLLAALSLGNDGLYGPAYRRMVFGGATDVGFQWLDPHGWADQTSTLP